LNQMWLSVAIILVSAAAAITGLLRAAPEAHGKDRIFAILPIALLAGWLTTAAPLNILSALTAKGFITAQTAPTAAMAGIVAAGLVGVAVALRSRSRSYPLPIAWGLAAIYIAERVEKPTVAMVAVAAAGVMLLTSAFVAFQSRRAG